MKKTLIIRPEAEEDLKKAHSWYDAQRPGLGANFIIHLDAALSSIQRNPEMYPIIYKNIRRCLVHRFPYGVFYIDKEDKIIVLGIMHAKRDPQVWKARV